MHGLADIPPTKTLPFYGDMTKVTFPNVTTSSTFISLKPVNMQCMILFGQDKGFGQNSLLALCWNGDAFAAY